MLSHIRFESSPVQELQPALSRYREGGWVAVTARVILVERVSNTKRLYQLTAYYAKWLRTRLRVKTLICDYAGCGQPIPVGAKFFLSRNGGCRTRLFHEVCARGLGLL